MSLTLERPVSETLPAAPAGMLSLTPAAVRKVRENLDRVQNAESLFLRLGVRGGGCSGFQYVLEFDSDVDPKYDRYLEQDGIRVVVDRKSLMFLAGTVLDYTGELHVLGEGGFEFKNPNASKSCGCGTSFQV